MYISVSVLISSCIVQSVTSFYLPPSRLPSLPPLRTSQGVALQFLPPSLPPSLSLGTNALDIIHEVRSRKMGQAVEGEREGGIDFQDLYGLQREGGRKGGRG